MAIGSLEKAKGEKGGGEGKMKGRNDKKGEKETKLLEKASLILIPYRTRKI